MLQLQFELAETGDPHIHTPLVIDMLMTHPPSSSGQSHQQNFQEEGKKKKLFLTPFFISIANQSSCTFDSFGEYRRRHGAIGNELPYSGQGWIISEKKHFLKIHFAEKWICKRWGGGWVGELFKRPWTRCYMNFPFHFDTHKKTHTLSYSLHPLHISSQK